MNLIKIQNAPIIDGYRDGHTYTRLPYPFYVNQDGVIQGQDLWQGTVAQVIGFQRDLARQQIDLWWRDAAKDPAKTVGMYLVTVDSKGDFATHTTAVDSAERLD